MTIKERNDIKYILLKERIKVLSKELDKEIKRTDPTSIYSTILISKHTVILELSCYIEELEQDTLQELVDKETPMKPLEDNYLGEFMCECGSPITKDYKYCPNCGQKLNWNKKEPCSSCKYNKICRVKK